MSKYSRSQLAQMAVALQNAKRNGNPLYQLFLMQVSSKTGVTTGFVENQIDVLAAGVHR